MPGAGIATAGITTLGSVGIVTITSGGSGYTTTPNVAITTAPSGGTDATAEAVMVVEQLVPLELVMLVVDIQPHQQLQLELPQPLRMVIISLMKQFKFLLVLLKLRELKYGMQGLELLMSVCLLQWSSKLVKR